MCHTSITREDALTERLFQGTIHALELFGIYIGKSLGLYRILNQHGPLTAPALAEAAGIHPRYAQEWLEQQAVAGFLVVDDVNAEPLERHFVLPTAHVNVLAVEDHLAHLAPFAQVLVGIAGALPKVVQAYRSGEGVPYASYGVDFRAGQGGINRPAFSSELVNQWLLAMPDLNRRLVSGERLRIADVGCGEGWACIALAKAFPNCEVVGIDADESSIEVARKNASEAGTQVDFVRFDAARLDDDSNFDLILLLETLHDLPQPEATLRGLRKLLAPAGSVLIADERVAESFVAPGDAIERMMYGWSITHCLPSSMASAGSAALGTALRPSVVERMVRAAGYARCKRLEIANDLFRFWQLQA